MQLEKKRKLFSEISQAGFDMKELFGILLPAENSASGPHRRENEKLSSDSNGYYFSDAFLDSRQVFQGHWQNYFQLGLSGKIVYNVDKARSSNCGKRCFAWGFGHCCFVRYGLTQLCYPKLGPTRVSSAWMQSAEVDSSGDTSTLLLNGDVSCVENREPTHQKVDFNNQKIMGVAQTHLIFALKNVQC